MIRKRRSDDKFVQIRLHARQYEFMKNLSHSTGLSLCEIFRQYITYLRAQNWKKRLILNDHSDTTFQLDVRQPE